MTCQESTLGHRTIRTRTHVKRKIVIIFQIVNEYLKSVIKFSAPNLICTFVTMIGIAHPKI